MGFGEGFDYTAGSPHLRHRALRAKVVAACQAAVRDVLDRDGRCRVLEVGAGHGTFTEHVAALGAEVWVTEMSPASADFLARRFVHNDRVHVVHDPDGTAGARGPEVDVVLAVSVLHHIPDYVGAVEALLPRIAPGGAFVSYQDPLWYPRRSRLSFAVDRGAYFAWRVTRGDLLRGVASLGRRLRHAHDPENPSDMVEYHVVRQGVDEQALVAALAPHFASVEVDRYWSTQAGWLQSAGERIGPRTTFGITATGRV
ncbi:class I SAM-dependent methyltransferase [Actinokineospora bangkokensis]|uniref:class I SAM-dependent methyltransferase n=1 Tax=Actinokineospora bangkokensis TaxID=1193682 RepID=UPI0018EA0B10|nr:class I SAM-dependent methyltransferase [Actinokineospora bangkokensis]